MIHRIFISLPSVLRQAENQTAVDFQAMRVSNPQADGVYDDFVLTNDNAPEAVQQLKVAAAVLENRFPTAICRMVWSPEEVMLEVETKNLNADCGRIRLFVEEYFKYSLLNWWYMVRSDGLSKQAALAVVGAINMLDTMLVVSVCVRRLRWW